MKVWGAPEADKRRTHHMPDPGQAPWCGPAPGRSALLLRTVTPLGRASCSLEGSDGSDLELGKCK